MKGIFELRTPPDLFRKLQADHEALVAAPTSSYAAYNFFVTGWHLLEWLYPGKDSKGQRSEIKDLHPVLQICEHLAVGAKHFSPSNEKLVAVEETGRASHWPEGHWPPKHWAKGHWRDALVVELKDEARERFGAQIDVLPLAEEVMKFWRTNEDLHRLTTRQP